MNNAAVSPTRPARLTRAQLWQFFLWVAFPIHAWALYHYFRSADRFAGRSNWEGLGLGGYVVLIALVESALVCGLFLLLGLLLPRRWPADRRMAALTGLYLTTAAWALFAQAVPAGLRRGPVRWNERLAPINQPGEVWPLALFLTLVLASLVLPLWIARYPRWQRALAGLAERVGLLSVLYLGLDALGIAIVLIRNVWSP
ncbi:MAG: hypothetical protein HYZ26_03620 [Chloroflexi bacterium]|nr:hypothetical protein [Chloroflexota bacterium]